jgi:hypothetical protein
MLGIGGAGPLMLSFPNYVGGKLLRPKSGPTALLARSNVRFAEGHLDPVLQVPIQHHAVTHERQSPGGPELGHALGCLGRRTVSQLQPVASRLKQEA